LPADPPELFIAKTNDSCTSFNDVRMQSPHSALIKTSKHCILCRAAAAENMSILLELKVTSKWCEPRQHHAICVSGKSSRGPEVHTEQSTRKEKTMSRMLASALVSFRSDLVPGFANHEASTNAFTEYTSASGIYHLLQQT